MKLVNEWLFGAESWQPRSQCYIKTYIFAK